jgi:CelD/BcsL family acetyltransferase involved in cellulose biosynthesis
MPDDLNLTVSPDTSGVEPPFDDGCLAANPHALTAAMTGTAATGAALRIVRCNNAAGELLALWPFAQKAVLPGIPVMAAPPIPLYDICGGPLVGATGSAASVEAMLHQLKAGDTGPRLLTANNLPADGMVWLALEAMASGGRIGLSVTSRWERAILERSAAPDATEYLSRAMSSASRKRLRNKRRALQEGGELTLIAHAEGPIAAAFDLFMTIEASGWKGRAGTALRQKPDDAAYVRSVMEAMAARNRAWIVEMRCGDQALAVGLILRCGGEASFWKTAYDEEKARFSPGVIFDTMVTEWLYDQPWFLRLDTGSDDSVDPDTLIWKERRAMVNAVISLDPGSLAGRLVAGMHRARHAARALKRRYAAR